MLFHIGKKNIGNRKVVAKEFLTEAEKAIDKLIENIKNNTGRVIECNNETGEIVFETIDGNLTQFVKLK
jgi:chemotaxis receptor (MCP) glutamine deamidase CheD